MIVRITSTNQNFLDLLKKNPSSFNGYQLRKHKNGTAIGRIVGPNEYHMVFHDTKYSYSQDTTNQIDFQSFCNPRVALGLVGTFLRHILVSEEAWMSDTISWLERTVEDLDNNGNHHRIEIDNIYADGYNLDRGLVLEKYFKEISLHPIGRNQFRLVVDVEENTLHYAINLATFVCMYLAATNRQPWFLNNDLAKKYIRVLENVRDVPYFILYLFARVCLPTEKMFMEFKPRIESIFNKAHDDYDLAMVYGNTQLMRLNHISDMLLDDGSINTNIVEIGCGEGDYPRKLARKLADGLEWWSHDTEDFNFLSHRVPERMRDSIKFSFTQDVTDIPIYDDPTVLMVEVIEHMPLEEATDLIVSTIERFNPRRMIITTPNRSFNKWYRFDALDRQFRHDDHDFELTTEEFESYIMALLDESKLRKYEAEFFGIGDRIGKEHISIGVELRK